jgi:hypothetical protein
MSKRKKGKLIFDECTDNSYKIVFENVGYDVYLSSLKRKVKGRYGFTDPELMKLAGKKHPVVTKDTNIVESVGIIEGFAGAIVLKQPLKGKEEIKYKSKISNYIKSTDEKYFNKKVVVIPLSGDVSEKKV